MLLISQKLIIEDFLGINLASFMSKMTVVSRRTIADDLKGKPTMAEKSRTLMMDDVKSWFIEKVTDKLPPEKLDDFDLFPDWNDDAAMEEGFKHRWSSWLAATEKGRILRQGFMKAYEEGVRIFPHESIKELQALEKESHAVSEAYRSNGWEAAKAVMLEGRDSNPLLYTGMFQQASLVGIDSSDKFQRYCSVLAVDNLMYMLALVDLGVSHNGDIATAESFFGDLLPVWEGKVWSCPIKVWLDGVRQELGLSINALGLAMARRRMSATALESKKLKSCNLPEVRNLRRWQAGKVILPWDTAIFICDKLDDECESDHVWWKHLCRYYAARILQNFHAHYMENHIVEGNPSALKIFYDEYPNWYRHHQALNSKTPA